MLVYGFEDDFGANVKVELNSNSGHPSPCSCLLLSQSFVVIISAPRLHIGVWWRDGVRGRLITCFGCRVSGSQCMVWGGAMQCIIS